MKTNKEILDFLGNYVVQDCYDPVTSNFLSLLRKDNPPLRIQEYVTFFKKLDDEECAVLHNYIKDRVSSTIFNLFKILEEHEEFKLIYEEEGKQVDLVEISEMLKAEHMIEGGWIDRFSKYAKDDEII